MGWILVLSDCMITDREVSGTMIRSGVLPGSDMIAERYHFSAHQRNNTFDKVRE